MAYDVIVVGGGLAGSTVGKLLAEGGARVLIVEREEQFSDRVRGEGLLPWGVNEARSLGIYEVLASCGHTVKKWNSAAWRAPRDLEETTPNRAHCLNMYHPSMQEAMIGAAEDAGAEVWRGVIAKDTECGSAPVVTISRKGETERLTARLVVAADGRASKVRQWGGFEENKDETMLITAGHLIEDVEIPDDTVFGFRRPGHGEGSLIFPLGDGRVRVYVIYRSLDGKRRGYSGPKAFGDFIDAMVRIGVPAEWVGDASSAGPLAEFDGACRWVHRPYQNGIALVGDAASASDPAWGNGLALTIRDASTLARRLLENDDWDAGATAYALDHEKYFGSIRRLTGWLAQLHYEVGPESDALREKAYPSLKADRSRSPDFIALGPEAPNDEAARRRLFGEDLE